jgi:hypothetical protein
VAHAGANAKSPASVGISSPSSQANLPDLLIRVIFFILFDFFLVFLEILVIGIVVFGRRSELKRRVSAHERQGFGPEWETFAAAVAAASPDAAAAAGFCAVGAGVVAPGVAGGGVAGFAPGAEAYVVQK